MRGRLLSITILLDGKILRPLRPTLADRTSIRLLWLGSCQSAPIGPATPPAPFEKSVAQKSSVSRPHSIEPPSSTDQSKGASPNSLSFLRTQLISDSRRCPVLREDDLMEGSGAALNRPLTRRRDSAFPYIVHSVLTATRAPIRKGAAIR